jgi:ribosomal protein S18 acetylase RimI-like enzyme
MIGFARVVTDYVTFAYLTDVYVLPEHQGRGLGVWMMECLQEMLEAWPALRRVMLMATSEHAIKMYERVLGMKRLGGGVMTRIGPGASAAFRDAETPN